MHSYYTAPDVDYVDLNGIVWTFGRDDHIACANISIINDDIIEGYDEQFDIGVIIQANVNYTYIGDRMSTFLIVDEFEGNC